MDEENRGYVASEIERKWQAYWDEHGTNSFTDEELREAEDPFYNLMMFPYPSAEGLHVGNIYAFTGADVHGRYQRLQGRQVFEPIGFDAFGIHSENFALKVGKHPMDLIPANIDNFTRQLRRIGGMFDWDHAVDTTHPSYYRWTQWVFLKLFDAGLAERKEAPVNWCPSCMTVLANEQVVGGLCERCDTPVEQRRIAQWFFRITDYAQRLLDNLDEIDWSETTTKAQKNWIGRSEGAEIAFPVVPSDELPAHGGAASGGDSAVPAPVDPGSVAAIEESRMIRVFTTRPDTLFGATFMVLAPEHPLVDHITTDAQRPQVEAYRQQAAASDLVSRQKTDKAKTGVPTGGFCRNPATGEAIPVWIADYVLMDYGTGAIMAVPGHDERDFEFATEFGLPIRRVIAGEGEDADTPLEEAAAGDGTLVNSAHFDGRTKTDAIRAVTEWIGERGLGELRVNFRLHDWCISRQRYWGPPIPIIHCDNCGAVGVPEDELPVVLPRVEDFKPLDDGISPLARDASWYETDCPQCGGKGRRETDVSDTFLDSGWYFLRYPNARFDDRALDEEITRKWLPVDTYIGGNEHAVLHLLYSRFLTMVLKDLGHVDFEEPFTRFRAHGLIIREGAKMSKSKGQRDRAGSDHRGVRGRHLPDLPDVPGALRRGWGLPGQGDRGPARIPVPTLRHRRERRGPRGRRRRRAQGPPDDRAGDRADPRARLQHLDRRDDGVPQRRPRRRPNRGARRDRAARRDGGTVRPPPGRGALGAPRPRGIDFRRPQLARVRSREGGGERGRDGRTGDGQAPRHDHRPRRHRRGDRGRRRPKAEENVARHLEGKTIRKVIHVPNRMINFVAN
jgi:leucyl-tRNA synthetase